MRYHVDSEVGQLRTAILHRPDLELKRLTPTNKHDLLFDDVLWVKRAKQEHDGFAESLRELGVRVLYFERLLRETLALPKAKDYVLDRVFRRARLRSGRRRAGAHARRRSRRPGPHRVPHRRADQARGAGADAGPQVRHLPRDGRRRLPPAPPAQPPVHPRHLLLDPRRRGDQLDAQGVPHPGVGALRGDLPLAPRVRRRRSPHLVRGRRAGGRRRWRAATSTSSAGARCWSG